MCPGEGDEDDVRVGAVSRPGGAQPQRGLEAAGHLCLQHRADPLVGVGGGGRQDKGARRQRDSDGGHSREHLHTLPHVAEHLRAEEETVFAARCPPEDACGSVNIHPLISIYEHGLRIPACWY